ncbi:MAG: hypothetical protein ATN34_01560 [Epulopiscium sp. Nele67-Bin002]|nr:MAG: hypothetical protein BEN18_06765 [Epulopiscium sp. Nuni2H_MBin001]OON90251.1 MAG: hypothetical protein ATN33_03440 [Epulopiscium sp. Nele67-Bin001]OON92324.1 MAG: hypothetical protein ATN34_01560 [Epulopiscium sp. Nele67-Bin002]
MMKVTAHAGCQDKPLDGLDYIFEAIKFNVDIIELDVRFYNGVPVLSHDPIYEGKNLVTVEQALNIIEPHCSICINYDMKEALPIDSLIDVICKTNMQNRGITTGCKLLVNDIIKLRNIGIDYFSIDVDVTKLNDIHYCEQLANTVVESSYGGINIDYRYVNAQIIDVMKRNNKLVFVWTVDDYNDIVRLKQLGVNSITTNKLEYLK